MPATIAPPNDPPAPGPQPVPTPPPPRPPMNDFERYRRLIHKLIDVIFDTLRDPSFWIIS